MSPPERTIILDNEAVQALATERHPKRQAVLAQVEAALVHRRRRGGVARLVVPTAVRVEAGWDRTSPQAASINRLRIEDHALDRVAANTAARIRGARDVSVADSHIGSVVAHLERGVAAVVTSDPHDIVHACSPATVTVITI